MRRVDQRIVAMVMIVALLAACTKTVRVPEEEFAALRPAKHSYIEVTTLEAAYRVSEFKFVDSTLVIQRMQLRSGVYPAHDDGSDAPPTLPYPVPLRAIRSITRTHWMSNTGVVAIAACGAILLFVLFLESFDEHVIYE